MSTPVAPSFGVTVTLAIEATGDAPPEALEPELGLEPPVQPAISSTGVPTMPTTTDRRVQFAAVAMASLLL
jgi:hypothetical protein